MVSFCLCFSVAKNWRVAFLFSNKLYNFSHIVIVWSPTGSNFTVPLCFPLLPSSFHVLHALPYFLSLPLETLHVSSALFPHSHPLTGMHLYSLPGWGCAFPSLEFSEILLVHPFSVRLQNQSSVRPSQILQSKLNPSVFSWQWFFLLCCAWFPCIMFNTLF